MNPDGDLPQQKKAPAIGDDLYDYSVEELQHRISLFEHEISRIREIYHQKTTGLDAANALFGKS